MARAFLKRILLAVGVAALYLAVAISYQQNPAGAICLVAAAATLALGIFVLTKDLRSTLNWAFFIFGLALSCHLVLVYLLHMARSWGIEKVQGAVRLLRNGNLLVSPALMYLGHRFLGGRSRFMLALTWLSLLFMVPFVLLNLLGKYVTSYKLVGATYVPANALGLYKAFAFVSAFWLLTWWGVFLVHALRPSVRARRGQYLLLFTGITIILFTGLLGFLPAFRDASFPVFFGLAYTAFPIILAIAVLRYNLFDIKIVVRRTLPYAAGTGLIGGAYAIGIGAVRAVGARVGVFPGGAEWVVLLLFMGFGFQPTLELLQKGLDRVFFRAEAELDRFLAEAGGRYLTAETRLALAREVARDASQVLKLEGAAVLMGCEGVEGIVTEGGLGDLRGVSGLPTPAGLARCPAVLAGEDGLLALGPGAQRLQEALGKARVQAVVPFEESETRGLLVCGQKLSHLPFSARDVTFLRALAAQAGMAMARIAAREEAAEARELTAAVFESMTNAVALLNPKSVVVSCNPAFREAFHEPLGRTLTELGLGGVDMHTERGSPQEIKTPGGTFLASPKVLRRPGNAAQGLLVLTDVTDLRRLELADRRREALAEIGKVVSSVNHEIMNLLSPVGFYLGKARELCREEAAAEALEAARRRIRTLEALSRELRDYYREPTLSLSDVHLRSVVESCLGDLSTEAGSAWVPPSTSGLDVRLRADPQRLKQVLLNILKNAWQAMDGASEKRWSIEAAAVGEGIGVNIRDGGAGMPPEVLERVFEPFFSTKKDSGSGLGLAICQRLAEAHGADIKIESDSGCGTTVSLLWPASRPQA